MHPTEDERTLAALSHASIVANGANLAGMIATTLIWVNQREKSSYVRAHALQSLIYQGAVLLIAVLLLFSEGLCLLAALLPMAVRSDLYRNSSLPSSFWFALLGLAVPISFVIVALLYGLYAAYRTYYGYPFSYPVIGRLVASATTASPATARASGVSSSEGPQVAPPAAAPPAPNVDTAAPPASKRRTRRLPPTE